MSRSQLPRSLRKFLRKEKARLRRGVLDDRETERKIKELVDATFEKYNKTKVLPSN